MPRHVSVRHNTCDGAEKKVVIFYENEFSEHSRYTRIIVPVNCGNVSIIMLGIMSQPRPEGREMISHLSCGLNMWSVVSGV